MGSPRSEAGDSHNLFVKWLSLVPKVSGRQLETNSPMTGAGISVKVEDAKLQ